MPAEIYVSIACLSVNVFIAALQKATDSCNGNASCTAFEKYKPIWMNRPCFILFVYMGS